MKCIFLSVRRVSPSFSIPPPAVVDVMLGGSLNITCVAVGAPMPFVKWRKDPATDLTPEDNLPVGKNVLKLTDIKESANYTCTAASDLGVIDATTMVKVQCSYRVLRFLVSLIIDIFNLYICLPNKSFLNRILQHVTLSRIMCYKLINRALHSVTLLRFHRIANQSV